VKTLTRSTLFIGNRSLYMARRSAHRRSDGIDNVVVKLAARGYVHLFRRRSVNSL
jgi:hypothetical protein